VRSAGKPVAEFIALALQARLWATNRISANVWSRGLLAGSESGIHNKGVVLASLWHQLAMIWFFSILKNNPLSCPFWPAYGLFRVVFGGLFLLGQMELRIATI
jgi:hypothetical protein